MNPIRRGDRGDGVRDVQSRLAGLGFPIDPMELESDRFDHSTERAVRAFQQARSLLVDGIVGPSTWEELVEAAYRPGDRILYLRAPGFRGDDVRSLQQRLDLLGFDPGRADGIFGAQTDRAVRDFQRNVGLDPDGIVGATTLDALGRLRPPLEGPGRTMVRETESLRSTGSLVGRVVAVDAGHGPGDPGAVGPSGLREADVTLTLAERLATELRSRGASAVLLRSPEESPDVAERVVRANASMADALISIHVNSHDDPSAEGSSSYFFGMLGTESVRGRALAELIQEALKVRTGLPDGRAHPKAFPLLRETPMPAVQVEPCFLTSPKEERLLGEERFRGEVVSGLADALERFFAGRL